MKRFFKLTTLQAYGPQGTMDHVEHRITFDYGQYVCTTGHEEQSKIDKKALIELLINDLNSLLKDVSNGN